MPAINTEHYALLLKNVPASFSALDMFMNDWKNSQCSTNLLVPYSITKLKMHQNTSLKGHPRDCTKIKVATGPSVFRVWRSFFRTTFLGTTSQRRLWIMKQKDTTSARRNGEIIDQDLGAHISGVDTPI
jgi:hypothetical protein